VIAFDLRKVREEVKKLERASSRPGFWDDKSQAQKSMERLSTLKGEIESYRTLEEEIEDLLVLNQLAVEESDPEASREVEEKLEILARRVEELEIEKLFADELDQNDAVLTIHPGAGGVDSQDWAEMLLRMYIRWADRRAMKADILDLLPGDEAGIKSVTLSVSGKYAFGLLKAEKGVHRLVRLSPFDASNRRHTSFASVDATPLIDDSIRVEIDKKDLRIETFRSSGPGGQHVNVTDSAVRITHLPTGIVVQCQKERSQISNRQTALKILRSKLYERERQLRAKEMEMEREAKKEIAWGNQIRSYVLHPYQLVKDHRTELERGNVEAVLDGDIDEFIEAYLKMSTRS
jgi:peptide chain release factor 2